MSSIQPTQAKERFVVLDALRGFALLGIAMANFPEFSLYTFLSETEKAAMGSANIDTVIRWLEMIFIDGKFYTLFSILFGIGFSIIIEHAEKRGADGFRIFYRRMLILLAIGLTHLLFLWSGDILALYAIIGMILPMFRGMTDRWLLRSATIFLTMPIAVDCIVETCGLEPAGWFRARQWQLCGEFGITEGNFAYWLRDQDSYVGVMKFLAQGAYERLTEFIDGNRYFKVMGLFILGYYIGRNRLYARVAEQKGHLTKVMTTCLMIGLPPSVAYAWSGMEGLPWGLTMHTVLYTTSVFPMGVAYALILALMHEKHSDNAIFRMLAAPGRMALSNYLGQTVWGMILFYGIGLGLGTQMGLWAVMVTVIVVYAIEAAFSKIWLKYFNYGLIEWIWRMLTYGKVLNLRR